MHRVFSSLGVALALLIVSVGQVEAQFPLNFSVGPTFANLTGDDDEGLESKTGFFIAAGTDIALNETFSLGPNLAYVQKGTSYEAGGDLSLDYIEIPVFLNATFPAGESGSFGFGVGPQVAFNISCDDDGFDCSDDENLNTTEFGIVAGANVMFPLSDGVGLSLGGGGDFGLSDPIDNQDLKNTVYYLLAGLSITVGG